MHPHACANRSKVSANEVGLSRRPDAVTREVGHDISRSLCHTGNSRLNRLQTMSTRGRSVSPQSRDVDVDMDKQSDAKPDAKIIVITNLTRNVVEAHLQAIFGFYGEVIKIDLPTYAKCVCTRPSHPRAFSFLNEFALSSWSKQRKSLSGICRPCRCPHCRLTHERRTTRRRRAQGRPLRFPPPHPRSHALPLPAVPPATKRARPPPFAVTLAFALSAVPAPGEGFQPRFRRLLSSATATAQAPATGRLSSALSLAFSVSGPPWGPPRPTEEVS